MENNATDDQKRAPKDKSMSRFFTICFQGLHSNDQRILSSVLDRADPDLIDNTVSPSISFMTLWRCPAFMRIKLDGWTMTLCFSDVVVRYDVFLLRPLCLWFKLWWGSSRYNKDWFWISCNSLKDDINNNIYKWWYDICREEVGWTPHMQSGFDLCLVFIQDTWYEGSH